MKDALNRGTAGFHVANMIKEDRYLDHLYETDMADGKFDLPIKAVGADQVMVRQILLDKRNTGVSVPMPNGKSIDWISEDTLPIYVVLMAGPTTDASKFPELKAGDKILVKEGRMHSTKSSDYNILIDGEFQGKGFGMCDQYDIMLITDHAAVVPGEIEELSEEQVSSVQTLADSHNKQIALAIANLAKETGETRQGFSLPTNKQPQSRSN